MIRRKTKRLVEVLYPTEFRAGGLSNRGEERITSSSIMHEIQPSRTIKKWLGRRRRNGPASNVDGMLYLT